MIVTSARPEVPADLPDPEAGLEAKKQGHFEGVFVLKPSRPRAEIGLLF